MYNNGALHPLPSDCFQFEARTQLKLVALDSLLEKCLQFMEILRLLYKSVTPLLTFKGPIQNIIGTQ